MHPINQDQNQNLNIPSPQNSNKLGDLFTKQGANYYLNPNSKLLLFSIDPSLSTLVRSSLNTLNASFFEQGLIADGGDLSNNTLEENCNQVFDLAFNQNKTIVLFGSDADFLFNLQQKLNAQFQPHRISCISDNCDPLNSFDLESIYLKELNMIGFQRQFSCPEESSIHYIRTGEFRANQSSIEPSLRRSEMVYFNLNAIRASDSPGNSSKNPSGFFAEEASTIARIAGMSDRLKIFVISSWNENKDPEKITSALVSQMVWYFWEGCHLKQLDQNTNRASMTQYLVEIKNLDYILKFYKSENSGKWWFEEPLIENEFSNQLIPCTYDEYLATAKDQIPSRILEMING
ncbi:MAG: hypothetical protein IPO86_08190 [Saprospiraceae bacterium]|nr:hypothetical protein [Saprospiraceae bacterium]MBK9728080.1 hypothetical protein [Saprospiraceae bacterium]